ncbi:hypothetical protein [Microbacterium sp. Bi128]
MEPRRQRSADVWTCPGCGLVRIA